MFTINYWINSGEGGNTETEELYLDENLQEKISEITEKMIAEGKYPTNESEELSEIFDIITEEVADAAVGLMSEGDIRYLMECEKQGISPFDNGYRIELDVSPYFLEEDEACTLFSKMFADNTDISEIEEIISNHADAEDISEEEIMEIAFRSAIEHDCIEFVESHIDDVDLMNDDEYGRTYLALAESPEMEELLQENGCIPSDEDMEDREYSFAVSTNEGEIISFSDKLQKEAFKKYKKENGMTNQDVINILEYDEDWESEDKSLEDIQAELGYLGISVEDDRIEYIDKVYDTDGYELRDLLEELGYDIEFVGNQNRFESTGYWYVE